MEVPTEKFNNKAKKQRKRIFFDEEIVTKEEALKLLKTHGKPKVGTHAEEEHEVQYDDKPKIKKKGQKRPAKEIQNEKYIDNSVKRKKKKRKDIIDNEENIESNKRTLAEESVDPDVTDKVDPGKPGSKPDSIRAQKRKKYAKLLEERKLKSELDAQRHGLNYLSKWKHSKDHWKFEKLRQVWLQNNLFDPSRIPNEFWDTTVEYFNGSKGIIRDKLLKDALAIIECEDKSEEENQDEDYQLKLKRARDIVQNLQE